MNVVDYDPMDDRSRGGSGGLTPGSPYTPNF